MPKKIPIPLLFTMAIVILALFTATEVRAFSDYCDPPVDTLTVEGWKVTLEGISVYDPEPGDPDPVCPWAKCYDWHYTAQDATGKYKGINYLAMLIPDCCIDPKVIVDLALPHEGFKWKWPVGVGEPTNCFGC